MAMANNFRYGASARSQLSFTKILPPSTFTG
jgi:hypothetical protein